MSFSPLITLAIELSTARGQVAVTRADATLYKADFTAQRSHNAKLFEPLREALDLAGDQLGRIVVGLGPGSYTGVRIAIASAQGIALSRSVPVLGLPSIVAPDLDETSDPFLVVGDARRGSYFIATVANGSLKEDIRLLPADELASRLRDRAEMTALTFDPGVASSHGVMLASPCALKLAKLGAKEKTATSSAHLEPIYLREAFITTPTRPWLKPSMESAPTSRAAADIHPPPPAP